MSELEDKINSILSSPKEMEKIMEINNAVRIAPFASLPVLCLFIYVTSKS